MDQAEKDYLYPADMEIHCTICGCIISEEELEDDSRLLCYECLMELGEDDSEEPEEGELDEIGQ